MKWTLILTFAVGLLLSVCQEDSTSMGETLQPTNHAIREEAFPFTIDPTKSGAYIGRDYMSAFFVGESNVVHVTFILPVAERLIRVPLGTKEENAITYYSGPSVAKYTLPQGVQRPFPKAPEYIQKKGISGVVSCRNAPDKGRFEYGRRIVLSLDQIDFGDGKLYQIKPMEMTVRAFPP